MIHSNKIRDADVHFIIDPITRAIKSASTTKTSVIQYDHNSERFTFILPRYIEGHDMMESTKVEVHYINANAAASGVYVVEDLQTDETEENVVCSWLLSQNVTQNAGVIHFLLRLSCIAEDGTVEYVWNTAIYKGISVASGMNNAEAVVEQYADVLEQWKRELFTKFEGIDTALDDVKNDINKLDKNDFELIASGVTTEEVNSIIITQDNDGNPFELWDMIDIYIYSPKSNGDNSYIIYDFNNRLVHRTQGHLVNSSSTMRQSFHAIYTGKIWDCYSATSNSRTAPIYSNTIYDDNGNISRHDEIVRNITIRAVNNSTYIPVGFKYEIYGRRVKK